MKNKSLSIILRFFFKLCKSKGKYLILLLAYFLFGTVYAQLQTPVTIFPTCGATMVITPITFNWEPVSGAAFYIIEISSTNTGWTSNFGFPTSSTLVNDNVLNGITNYTWGGADPGTSYYYSIQAVDASGFGASDYCLPCQFTTTTTPCSLSPPSGVTAQALSTSSIIISWNNVNNADHYVVYDHGSIPVDGGQTTTTSYTHSGLIEGSTHCYTVSACCNYISCSSPSTPEVCVSTINNTTYVISGKTKKSNGDYIPYAQVTFTGTAGFSDLNSVPSFSDGAYIRNGVPPGWTGTITGQKSGYAFETITIPPVNTHKPGTHIIGSENTSGAFISTTPGLLNFGDVYIGNSSDLQTLTISNTGDQTLVVNTITSPSGYILSGFSGGNIDTGQSEYTYINFSPIQAITYDTLLQISSNAANTSLLNIPLSGTGIDGNSCSYSDTSFATLGWAYNAAVFLCGEGLLDDDGYCEPEEEINRAGLAKLAFKSINLHNNPVKDIINEYPSPFIDLQVESTENDWYFQYAKNLYYLEFEENGVLDGVTVLDKLSILFEPANTVKRGRVLKILMESWDIPIVDATTPPFNDVSLNHEFVNYISTAKSLDIISSSQNLFRPNDNALRAEVFVMLYNIMNDITIPSPDIDVSDYFVPGNYTPKNLAAFNAMHSGNFNFYTKTSFAIPSIGIPLVYAHTYNSYATEITSDLYPIKPLGFGWSHSYNSYIVEKEKDVENGPSELFAVISFPDGGFNVYENTGANNYETITEGVYSTLEKPNGGTFVLRTKNQMTYVYEKFDGTPASFPYVLTSIRDRNNNTLIIDYQLGQNGYYRIYKVIGTAGRELLFTYYDNCDLISSVTDPLGRVIQYDYSGYNFSYIDQPDLTSFTNANGDYTSYNYGNTATERHLLKTIALPKGNVIINTYEQKKLTSTSTNPNTITEYIYDRHYNQTSLNNYVEVTNISPNGVETYSQYNQSGLIKHSHTANNQIDIDYHASQNTKPTNITIDNKPISMVYDNNGNLREQHLPMGINHYFNYNSKNDITKYTDPEGHVYNLTYDYKGNLIEYNSPRASTHYVIKSNGLVNKTINPENIETSFVYDNYGNVKEVNSPLGIKMLADYDLGGRIEESINPNGQTSTYIYDNNDNTLTQSIAGIQTTFNYDNNDNLVEIINAKNNSTTLNYNFDHDYLEQVSFGGFSDNYTYNDEGQLYTSEDPENNVFTYGYDALSGNLSSINSPSGQTTYTYNSDDILETVSENNNQIGYYYDDLNRIITIDYNGESIGYTYDLASNLKSIIYPGNKVVNYSYYNDNLLKSVTDWNNNTTSYSYRNDGLLSRIDNPNGTYCSYTYDQAGRMTEMGWRKVDNSVINNYKFTLDPMGNHLSEEVTELYEPYVFTPINITATYDNANRIQNYGSIGFDFHDNGTYESKGTSSFVFDENDMLLSVSGDNMNATYQYDPLLNRRERAINGVTTKYTLDILGMSRVLIEKDATNNAQRYYVYGLGLISTIDATDQTSNYYHYDFRGSTTAISDENANVTHQYQYGPFGELLQSTETFYNPFRYVGQFGVMHEFESLYFMRARYYDVETGRFVSEDLVWDTNLYAYAGGNPTMGIDPNGKLNSPIETFVEKGVFEHAGYEVFELLGQFKANISASVSSVLNRTPVPNQINSIIIKTKGSVQKIITNANIQSVLSKVHELRPSLTKSGSETFLTTVNNSARSNTIQQIKLAQIRKAGGVLKNIRFVGSKLLWFTVIFDLYGGTLGGQRHEIIINGETQYLWD